jgi:hypothetical protein
MVGLEGFVFIALKLFHSFSRQLKDLLIDLLFLNYRRRPRCWSQRGLVSERGSVSYSPAWLAVFMSLTCWMT